MASWYLTTGNIFTQKAHGGTITYPSIYWVGFLNHRQQLLGWKLRWKCIDTTCLQYIKYGGKWTSYILRQKIPIRLGQTCFPLCASLTSRHSGAIKLLKAEIKKPSWRVEKPSITKKRTISFWRVTLNPPTKRNVGIGSCRWTNTGAFRWTLFPLPPSRLKEQDIVYLAIYYIYNISPIIHPIFIYNLSSNYMDISKKKPDIVTTCDTIDAPTRQTDAVKRTHHFRVTPGGFHRLVFGHMNT